MVQLGSIWAKLTLQQRLGRCLGFDIVIHVRDAEEAHVPVPCCEIQEALSALCNELWQDNPIYLISSLIRINIIQL